VKGTPVRVHGDNVFDKIVDVTDPWDESLRLHPISDTSEAEPNVGLNSGLGARLCLGEHLLQSSRRIPDELVELAATDRAYVKGRLERGHDVVRP
jgi:hypothetical protein